MADLHRIKQYMDQMIKNGATDEEIDQLISDVGSTVEEVRAYNPNKRITPVDTIMVGGISYPIKRGSTKAQVKQFEKDRVQIYQDQLAAAKEMETSISIQAKPFQHEFGQPGRRGADINIPIPSPVNRFFASYRHEAKKLKLGVKDILAGPGPEPEIEEELAEMNRLFKPVKEVGPVATFTGSFGPYTAPIGTAASLGGKLLTQFPKVSKAITKATAFSPLTRTPANIAKSIWATPVARETTIGGLEGYVHPEDTALWGAAIPLGLSSAGRIIGRGVELPGVKNITPQEQAIIQRGHEEGLVATPGRQTGYVPTQQYDQALKQHPSTSGVYDETVAQPNERANTKIILRSFDEGGDQIDDEVVKRIENRLGNQYDEVLSDVSSDSKILSDELQKVRSDMVNELDKADQKIVQRQMDNISNATKRKVPGKKPIAEGVTGERFQDIDRKLRRLIKEKNINNPTLARTLEDVRKSLHKSMAPSMGDKLGKFNELNQQWAFLSTIKDSMTATGRLDVDKLSSKLASYNPSRYSLGKVDETGPAGDITFLSKWHQIQQRGGTLSSIADIAEQFKNFRRGGIGELMLQNYLRGVTPKTLGFPYGTGATVGGRAGTAVSPESEESLHPLSILKRRVTNPLFDFFDRAFPTGQ